VVVVVEMVVLVVVVVKGNVPLPEQSDELTKTRQSATSGGRVLLRLRQIDSPVSSEEM
jgi:hypothetical protein